MKANLFPLMLLTYVVLATTWVVNSGWERPRGSVQLLNAANDPTRELWREINERFIARHEQEHGVKITIRQSHGGSSSQARAVIDGLDADVATLALWSDTDAIRKAGLIEPGWENRFRNRSLPYVSTIVFVVRKGNPKGIYDWTDLVRPDVQVITPSPKTSGNGKWSFLAAWGAALDRGETEEEARKTITRLYRNVPVLDTAARGATMTFSQKKIGDVHLTWENEAQLETTEARGELEIVTPPKSILAEPHIALVTKNVERKGTKAEAEAYLNFLYTEEAQEIIARHGYRPTNPETWSKVMHSFSKMELFPVTRIAKDWDEIQKKFFAEGAIFDRIYSEKQ